MFFNKYPYTDFHELNLDWILKQLDIFKDEVGLASGRLTEAEADIDALENRATSLEGRMTTAEGNITSVTNRTTAVEGRMTNAEGRITSLENANIQDAVMLKEVSSVAADASKVRVNFVKDTYTDGAKASGSDYADVPAATESAAGVLLPEDKTKLGKMTRSGNDISFAGKVTSGSAPTAGSDLTNKTYVDSLAISGSATIGTDSNIFSTALATNKAGATIASSTGEARTYGQVKEILISCRMTFSSNTYLEHDDVLAYGMIKNDLIYPANAVFPCVGRVYKDGANVFYPMIAFVGTGVGGQAGYLYLRWLGGHMEANFTHLDIFMSGTYL